MNLLLCVQKELINAEECDSLKQEPSDTRLKPRAWPALTSITPSQQNMPEVESSEPF